MYFQVFLVLDLVIEAFFKFRSIRMSKNLRGFLKDGWEVYEVILDIGNIALFGYDMILSQIVRNNSENS